MNSSQDIMECVPNFSEGRDEKIIQSIAAAIRRVPGQQLLHIDASPSANRTVMTFAGHPEAVAEAAFRAIKVAAEMIDMRRQLGVHPRLGATDVCPMVPLREMNMAEAVYWSDQLAQRVGRDLGIPVYLYEAAARQNYRRALPDIRKGQYEGLGPKMLREGWLPDYGFEPGKTGEGYQRTGATIIGARNILVAFNISLNTKDIHIAREIAKRMRSRDGGLEAVRAIGWMMEDFDCAQVSMNLLDYRLTSPLKAWEVCRQYAAEYGVTPVGCEVVGLIPEACLKEAGGRKGPTADFLQQAIDYLGLDKVKPFDPQQKVLEYALQRAGLI